MALFKSSKQKNTTFAIYGICIAIVSAFVFSNLYVLFQSGNIANLIQHDATRELVRNEINRQVEHHARDQSQISYWDATVEALSDGVDEEFIDEEVANWLWEDFDIQTTIFVGANGQAIATIFKDKILAPKDGQTYIRDHTDLIEGAQFSYMTHRRAVDGGGYTSTGNPLNGANKIYTSDIRAYNGQLAFIVAQAIIPSDEAALPDGLPNVLLTIKPITPALFAEISEQLGFEDFAIIQTSNVDANKSSFKVSHSAANTSVFVTWQTLKPAETIIRQSIPAILAFLLFSIMALIFIAIKHGNALGKLVMSEEKNRFLAFHDALTGLPNRLHFDRELEDILSKGKQDRCAILCVDLDRFKSVNDTYGHQAGDTVIKVVAERIASTVSDKGLAARIGGDEFIILLESELDRDSVVKLSDQIIADVSKDINFDGGVSNVGASIGVAWWPDDALTAKNIIRSADEALYRAKENGRGRTHFASVREQKRNSHAA